MVSYPYHQVNGLSLTDPAGRWHEAPSAQVLPTFPGLRTSSFDAPGRGGLLSAPSAPRTSLTVPLEIVVNAVDSSGKPASSIAERKRLVAENLDQLYMILGLGLGEGTEYAIELGRVYSAGSRRMAYGRIISASTPRQFDYADYATVTLLVQVNDGMWRSISPETSVISAGSTVAVPALSGSTAPVSDAELLIVGPVTNPTVVNAVGAGFRIDMAIPAGQYITVDPVEWTYSAPAATPATFSTLTADKRADLRGVGGSRGSSLTILPDKLNGSTVKLTGSGTTSATKLHVRAKKAYY